LRLADDSSPSLCAITKPFRILTPTIVQHQLSACSHISVADRGPYSAVHDRLRTLGRATVTMRRHPIRASQMLRAGTARDTSTVSLINSFDSDLNPSRPAKSSPLGASIDTGLPLELLDRLKAFPLFQSAPESFLLSIGKSLRPTIYQPAQEIVREGEDAKAMYWLVRGSVRVTSRDGESTYAELKPGAFFGEIGILMDMPRTASIVASIRSLLVRLNKEDLQKELPSYPEVERAIREEALERLTILERKKKEKRANAHLGDQGGMRPPTGTRKRSHDWMLDDVDMGEAGSLADGEVVSHKKRKSPSPGIAEVAASSALGSGPLTVRQLLKELPLFSGLPSEILHFLGINAQPASYPPFTEIIKQDSDGRDVYFIVKGDVEVLTNAPESLQSIDELAIGPPQKPPQPRTQARLRAGQYFGEVTTLNLAPKRTATVRSVSAVECLQISGSVLDELWQRCGPDIRQQVESEARRRLRAAKKDNDVVMVDVGGATGAVPSINVSTNGDSQTTTNGDEDPNSWRADLPTVKFDGPLLGDLAPTHLPQMEPIDPDPFFNENLDNMRARSRRSSLAPPLPPADSALSEPHRVPSPPTIRLLSPSPLKPHTSRRMSTDSTTNSGSPSSPVWRGLSAPRRPSLDRKPSNFGKGRLPDTILASIFQHLDLFDLMRCREVSMHWHHLLTTSREILQYLDLSRYNRYVTDETLRDVIVPFVGDRPSFVDISNCFHMTDEGFKQLTEACGANARVWKMKSVWDVSGPAVLALVDKAKNLEEIDLSNCRKVGDNLLARVVGWVVPEPRPSVQMSMPHHPNHKRGGGPKRPTLSPSDANNAQQQQQQQQQHPAGPPPGTVIGAANLKRITLSYCKHIQDRSMAHLAAHTSARLQHLDLTRCTSISDAGFHAWSAHAFPQLHTLILADCTYLSDAAIAGVTTACRALRVLDLSFCCALSDGATETLARGLPRLQRLDLAFCGSAVSDHSLRCIGLHLRELRYLGVRGCVRVTGLGVEGVVEGCRELEVFDVSQCKNLRPWLDRKGIGRTNSLLSSGAAGPPGRERRKSIRFETVADGSWRAPAPGPASGR
jgi:F-box/leucine-rich repeat protein 7